MTTPDQIEVDLFLLGAWTASATGSFYIGLYRSFVDRIRAGLIPMPSDNARSSRLIEGLLQAPNQDRPFHTEAALLSSLQVLVGFFAFSILFESLFSNKLYPLDKIFGFLLVISAERLTAGLLPRWMATKTFLRFHLRIGYPWMYVIRTISAPLTLLLRKLDSILFRAYSEKSVEIKEENDVADHIHTLGREGSNLDPGVFEILENTIEMGQLHVKDVMIPRNQVQILDEQNSLEDNLEYARSCGHTRLPLCKGDLDQCIGIFHVKYAFRFSGTDQPLDLKSHLKAPALVSAGEPLPGALKKMMRWKVHMALVRDEFGGVDGVITLEDILEEVVGDIQDEFDAEENFVERLEIGKWRISGQTPVHELPEELGLDELNEELTSLGGMITTEIGRIPEKGERISLQNLKITILEADDTKVLKVQVEKSPEISKPTS